MLIDGRLSRKLKNKGYPDGIVIIPEAVISELEAMANRGRETGFKGLEELKELAEMAKRKDIELVYVGKRPTLEQVKLAPSGEIDAMIRSVALENNALFVTSDRIQSEVARAMGLDVEYLRPEMTGFKALAIESFFTDDTLSVHLKERVTPAAKRGTIGEQKLVELRDTPCTEHELRSIARELIERARQDPDSFIEIEHDGVMVLQIGTMRIAVAQPPFSDGMEITAVRPVAKVDLDSYRMSKELKDRLLERQRGILIAGPPGAGKSTFAASIAEFLLKREFIVKTMESPRDLQVSDAITQYAPIDRDMEKTADILLLVRPDYTIYDEVRKTSDFRVFADMRLAGIGMIGVVHATRAVDAVQRLIGRVDLGMIPQVVDTVMFIEKGQVSQVYNIDFSVKVPHGMTEEDLSRPVIVIKDFETSEPEFEIYTYGEQVVVMPIAELSRPMWKLAEKQVEKEIKKYAKHGVEAQMVSDTRVVVWVSDEDAAAIIGKGGRTVEAIEQMLGLGIDVRVRGERNPDTESYTPSIERTKKHVVLHTGASRGDTVGVFIGGKLLLSATVGRKGEIRVGRDSEAAYRILEAQGKGERIVVKPGL